MKSKSQLLSQNWSDAAGFTKYNVLENSILVGNQLPIGSLSIDQSSSGFSEANVQDAIGDLAAAFELPLGSVLVNDTGISPGGIQQSDTIAFTGSVNAPGKNLGETVNVNLYGIFVEAVQGDTSDEFTAKAKIVLDSLAFENKIFTSVEAPIAGQIQVQYIDYKPHTLKQYTSQGITVTQTVDSPPRVGYGSWERLGSQTLTLDGASDPVVLYYFKRVG